MTGVRDTLTAAFGELSGSIQSLGRFAQMDDFRSCVPDGYAEGLMDVYRENVRCLTEVQNAVLIMLEAENKSAPDDSSDARGQLEHLRQTALRLHRENTELREENAELRATLCRERWDEICQDEARKAPPAREHATQSWGIGATSELGRDE